MNTNLFHPYAELAASLSDAVVTSADGAHDTSHLERVWLNAKIIQAEAGGDLEAIGAAVVLHDCVQVPKDSPLRSSASRLAAKEARVRLDALGWPPSRIEIVAKAIESHSFSAGIEPSSIEGEIVQDADRLDAIGMTGIARCFYTAGRMGSQLYEVSDPSSANRVPDDKSFALDHFPAKLLTLARGFRTATGRRLAEKRHRAIEHFYREMLEEVSVSV